MADSVNAVYGSLPFAEQAAFFRRKINLPTDSWTDIYKQEHDYAFVVAGANRDAIVVDFRQAVAKAIDGGSTLEDFRKDFDRIVATHGWDYNGGRDWRSRVIYDTNLSTSYAAGRYEQLQSAPYWQYVHQEYVADPRPQHVAWNGRILAKGDPWLDTHYPPNGWGCHCTMRGLWPRDLERMGKTGPDKAPPVNLVERVIGKNSAIGPRTVKVPDGIDPGFEYAPGAARLKSAMPPESPDPPVRGSTGGQGLPNRRPLDALPKPRQFPSAQLLPSGLPPQDYAAAFLAPLGATLEEPAIFADITGERLVVGKDLFTDVNGDFKADKRGRGPYMPMLAQALLNPDEIWVRLEWLHALQKAVVRRRYIARFDIDGQDTPALSVFELGQDGWSGVTAFNGVTQDEDAWRIGVRLYNRNK